MVAPVVLITLATIFANGLLAANITVIEQMHALSQERLAILAGPHGEILDENSVPPIKRERLRQIRDEIPPLSTRARKWRIAILISWISIGILVLSVCAIAVAVTVPSEAFAFTAMALVIAGVAAMFTAVATAIVAVVTRSTDIIAAEARHMRLLGLDRDRGR